MYIYICTYTYIQNICTYISETYYRVATPQDSLTSKTCKQFVSSRIGQFSRVYLDIRKYNNQVFLCCSISLEPTQ